MERLLKSFFVILGLFLICFTLTSCKDDEEKIDYEKVEVKVDAGKNYTVDGEILIPKLEEKVPAVVIVPGSGPMDMDGTVKSQKVYESLARGLAELGIASIRYNKVTYQHLNDVAKDYDFTIEDEYLPAISSAISILKAQNEIDVNKIYLIGHSLGSQVIPLVLNSDESLAGGIIMAGTTMHILDLILEQVKRQDDKLYEEYLPHCTYAKGLTEVPVGEEKYVYFGAYTAYYVNYNKLNLELVKELDCPLLIMQGKKDLQVTMEHFNKYRELLKEKENVEFIEYEKLNHLFSNGVGENINTAYLIKRPVEKQVIEDICNFIKNN